MSPEYELVERCAGRENTILRTRHSDWEWIAALVKEAAERYRLYHGNRLVSQHDDINGAFEELHRRSDPPHRHDWRIERDTEVIFGTRPKGGRGSLDEFMEAGR